MKETIATGKRQYRMNARARRTEATAERIRSVAMEQFLSRPYDEVTLAGIAEAAGVVVTTLLTHFGRKEDLFAAAGEEWANRRVIEPRRNAPLGDHAAAVRGLLDSYESQGRAILHLLAEEDRFPAVKAATDFGREYHRDWVEHVFEPSLASLRGARREELVIQLIVATDVFAWKVLRLDMGLSRRRTEASIAGTVDALTRDA